MKCLVQYIENVFSFWKRFNLEGRVFSLDSSDNRILLRLALEPEAG